MGKWKKWFGSKDEFSLFVKDYSTSYFGIKQARDIDALRCSIEKIGGILKNVYLAALFYAMKECIKDVTVRKIYVIDKGDIDNGIFEFSDYDEREYFDEQYKQLALIEKKKY